MKLTAKEKRQLVVNYIELLIFCGYDITDVVCRPLNYFDYDKLKEVINKLESEKEIIGN